MSSKRREKISKEGISIFSWKKKTKEKKNRSNAFQPTILTLVQARPPSLSLLLPIHYYAKCYASRYNHRKDTKRRNNLDQSRAIPIANKISCGRCIQYVIRQRHSPPCLSRVVVNSVITTSKPSQISTSIPINQYPRLRHLNTSTNRISAF